MSITFDSLVTTLKKKTAMQKIPIPYGDSDYADHIIHGIKELLIDFGYSDLFESYCDTDNFILLHELSISQESYVLNAAMIDFYQVLQQDVNKIVGYSTDSLSITNADKPYANISNEINKLSARQTELFSKIHSEGVDW